jgi:hypothetical protein
VTPYRQVGGTGIRRNYVLLISSRLKRKLLQDIHPKRRQALTRLHGAAEQENIIRIKETGIFIHGDVINYVRMCIRKHVRLLSVCPIQTSKGRSLKVITIDKAFLNE